MRHAVDWKVVGLRWLVRMKSGEGLSADKVVSEEEGEYPLYGSNGVRGWTDSYTHDTEAIIVGRQGSIGTVHRAKGKFWASEHALVTTPLSKDRVDVCWLGYLLESLNLERLSTATAQPGLSVDRITSLRVLVPPVEEQRRIAAFLDHETARIDELVREQEQLVRVLRSRFAEISRKAVHQGVPVASSQSDVRGSESVGAYPSHWDVVPLKYLVRFASGNTPTRDVEEYWGGDIPWVSAKDMKTIELVDSEERITPEAVFSGGANLLPPGSVITVVRGMILAHTLPVAINRVPLAINQDLKALMPGSRLTSEFLREVLLAKEPESLSRLGEAAHGTKALRMDQWTTLEIPVPPIEEQVEIAKWIERQRRETNALIHSVKQASALLIERRSALISAAVTGHLDLCNWQPPEPEAVAEVA